MASRFGWPAVSDRPMDWAEYQAALLLVAEERVGRASRQAGQAEDDEFAQAQRALSGRQ